MKKFIVLLSIFAMLLMISCSDNNNANVEVQDEIASDSVTEMHFDHDISTDLEGLSEKATHIVIGEMVKVIDSVNLTRNFNDHSLSSEEEVFEGERTQFRVTKVLKGELTDEEIIIVSAKSFQSLVDEDNQKYDVPYYNAPEIGKRVIVFLNFNPELRNIFPLELNQFEPASSPYMFSFDGKKAVKIIEKDQEVKTLFKDLEFDLAKLEKIINKSK